MRTRHFIALITTLVLAACSKTENPYASLADMPVVAHIDTINGEPLTVCRLDLLKDTVRLPLSALVEELQIIRLDNRDEALVEPGEVYFSDNHILIVGWKTPCKLFRKDGTYINKVGSLGYGPGEYKIIHDAQIDEKHGRIYLLPQTARAILVYNLEGKFEGTIPLHLPHPQMTVAKGIFHVDAEKKRVSVASLPFDYLPRMAWVQDLEGNLLDIVPAGHLKLKPNYSNQLICEKRADQWSFHLSPFFELRKDSLYHWNLHERKLIPRFTIDFGQREISLHNYNELPLYYYGYVASPKQMTKNSFMADREQFYIVDKSTLRGGFCHIYNDYLCDEPTDWMVGKGGYYIENVEPGTLLERIEKWLEETSEQDTDRRKRLLDLKAGIGRNDNNYIIYGKHRTEK